MNGGVKSHMLMMVEEAKEHIISEDSPRVVDLLRPICLRRGCLDVMQRTCERRPEGLPGNL